jgi:hypothetical protein
MLPKYLNIIRDTLSNKGVLRSRDQDRLLEELNIVDAALEGAKKKDKTVTEPVEKRASSVPSILGPTPGKCPTCGADW